MKRGKKSDLLQKVQHRNIPSIWYEPQTGTILYDDPGDSRLYATYRIDPSKAEACKGATLDQIKKWERQHSKRRTVLPNESASDVPVFDEGQEGMASEGDQVLVDTDVQAD